MNYVGIDWAYGRAAFCAMGDGGEIKAEGMIPADETGRARLAIELTFAAEIGEVSRFASPAKLVGYAGLAPRVSQSGERSATGRLSKAGSKTLRWAAVEAANQAWRKTNPWHPHYRAIADRHGKNPAKSAVARKILIASWHMLSRREAFRAPPLGGASPLRQAPAAF